MNALSSIQIATDCLEVTVIYTGTKETLAALRTAGQLARDLSATIQVLVPEVVPYPLDLNTPPIAEAFAVRKFQTLAEGQPVPTKVQRLLCRERASALQQTLSPHSTVVIGSRRRWWKRGWKRDEPRLAAELRAQGHEVISVAA